MVPVGAADIRRQLPACAVVLVFVALVVVPAALADYGMVVRKTHVRPGELMTIWGNGCRHPRFRLGMRVYLVAYSRVSRTTIYMRYPPDGPPFHFLGRFWCTHVTRPQPLPGGGYWTGTLRFRLPRVSPGRYQLFLYCLPCRKGPGGNLIANNYYLDGKRRYGLHSLRVGYR
jgi:hypothetical protein